MADLVGVITTGIYCCPGDCAGRPKPENRRPFSSPAAAEAAGFRACFVCRPYRRQDGWEYGGPPAVCYALQLVLDGALDEGGTEADLAARVGTSARHLRRLFVGHLGITPSQLARSARAHFARRLIDDTDLPMADIAHLSSFGSIRQFNKVMHETFRATPTQLRSKRKISDRLVADGGLTVRLPYSGLVGYEAVLRRFEAEAVAGVAVVDGESYRRTIHVRGDMGVLEVTNPGRGCLEARFHLPHWRELLHLSQRTRRLFDLDYAGSLPRAIGCWDAFEVGVQWLVARHQAADSQGALREIVLRHGRPAPGLEAWGLSRLFPTPQALGSYDGDALGSEGARQLRVFAAGVAGNTIRLERSAGIRALTAQLGALGDCSGALAGELVARMALREPRVGAEERELAASGRPE